jgi:septal ring factor EnvC (AmiA/AmiB activator)
MHDDLAHGWERLQFHRMRAQVEDQEAELREKEVQLATLYHELQEERLRHGATREALAHRFDGTQRSMDTAEVLKELSALGDAVGQLKRQQQEILQHYSPSGEFTSLLLEDLPL